MPSHALVRRPAAMERWDGSRGPGNLNATPPCPAPSSSPASTVSAASPSPTPTTGCAAEPTAGRRPKPASSASAGPTPSPTSHRGEPPFRVLGNNPLVIAVPRAGRPRRPRHGDVPVLLRSPRRTPRARRTLPVDGGFDSARATSPATRRHRGLAAPPPHRLLERLRPLARSRSDGRHALRRRGHPPDCRRSRARSRRLPDLPGARRSSPAKFKPNFRRGYRLSSGRPLSGRNTLRLRAEIFRRHPQTPNSGERSGAWMPVLQTEIYILPVFSALNFEEPPAAIRRVKFLLHRFGAVDLRNDKFWRSFEPFPGCSPRVPVIACPFR